jgi:putative transcriptional regulator
MNLGNRIRDVRLLRGLTQQSLAQAVGVTRQTIIAVEKGTTRPSVELALKLAHVLGTPLPELFWLEDK